MRPAMARVVSMLAGDLEVETKISKPSYNADWHLSDLSSAISGKDFPGSNPETNSVNHTVESEEGCMNFHLQNFSSKKQLIMK